MDSHSQHGYECRFGWGSGAIEAVEAAAAIVVVDVLSFSTTIDIAVAAGAVVYPLASDHHAAEEFAARHGAHLAVAREAADAEHPYSLSPRSMGGLRPGDRVVLPSPNGARLSLAAAGRAERIIAGCLRNATAVAAHVAAGTVTVVAAGERWPDGTLRPGFEDLIGAGAILAQVPAERSRSPEAAAAEGAFAAVSDGLAAALLGCASGRELVDRGWAEDVLVAAALDESRQVPTLIDGAYRSRP